MASGDCAFDDPGTLKDILDLLAKLFETKEVQQKVSNNLVEEIKGYCKDPDKFYKSGSSEYLPKVFSTAKEIRGKILQSTGNYGNYEIISDSNTYCAEKIVKALKKCLPECYAALYFLYFNGLSECTKIGGGLWSTETCKSGSLNQWLTDNPGSPSPGLIQRGFDKSKSHLTSNKGQQVADAIKNIITHDNPEDLQEALCYLLFLGDWHPAKLGHGVLLLYTFCEKVIEVNEQEGTLKRKFNEKYPKGNFDTLKEICTNLQSNLANLVMGFEGGLQAVCQQGNDDLYDDVWNADYFEEYCEWLERNLEGIIKSLQSMSEDSKDWTSYLVFQWAKSAGPFKYGFVFKGNWDDNTFKSSLKGPITQLYESLEKLKRFLDDPSAFSKSPASAIGGSVTMLGTAGIGAGAAYGLNLFGFKDIVSGLLSSILK